MSTEIDYWRTRAEIASELWHAYQKQAEPDRQMLTTDNRLWVWRTMWFSEIERQSLLCRQKILDITIRGVLHDQGR